MNIRHVDPGTLVPFMLLAWGQRFRVPGLQTVYRKLDGVTFECVHEAPDRVTGFKAFDDVEVLA